MMAMLLVAGCKEKSTKYRSASKVESTVSNSGVTIGKETSLLLKELEENGDYVKSQLFPSLITASIVQESLDNNILVIDLRTPSEFSKGHIPGAVNENFENLPGFFEVGIKPYEFNKIILVCLDGQISSYTASLMRMMSYGNVYAMRWGMSAWNMECARMGWLRGVSGKYEVDLEKALHEKPAPKGMPELTTGLSTGADISTTRFATLFAQGTRDILITADEVFADPSRYYIINLERKDRYEDGHIPGAIRYKDEATLGFADVMATIPADQTVVVYCGTGHNSGFATAFLRLFGYDARTLRFGNNSFMYDKMILQKRSFSWIPFTKDDIHDFELTR